jgi:hypothetical protein
VVFAEDFTSPTLASQRGLKVRGTNGVAPGELDDDLRRQRLAMVSRTC